MALVNFNFFSYALGHRSNMRLLLPQPAVENWWETRGRPAVKFPVIYLLHGFSNDETEWTRFSSLERYLEHYNLAVVMPSVQRSLYVDIGNIHRYWTFLSEELPALARSYFPISDRPQDTFVAGLSMGGYGAFKLALSYPDRFAAAASFSGALNFAQVSRETWWQEEVRLHFGEHASLEGGPHDLFYLARQVASSDGPKPRLYMCSGTEDFVYQGNQAFKRLAESLGMDLTYEEGPGIHDYGYVDPMIPRMLAWLPLPPSETNIQNI